MTSEQTVAPSSGTSFIDCDRYWLINTKNNRALLSKYFYIIMLFECKNVSCKCTISLNMTSSLTCLMDTCVLQFMLHVYRLTVPWSTKNTSRSAEPRYFTHSIDYECPAGSVNFCFSYSTKWWQSWRCCLWCLLWDKNESSEVLSQLQWVLLWKPHKEALHRTRPPETQAAGYKCRLGVSRFLTSRFSPRLTRLALAHCVYYRNIMITRLTSNKCIFQNSLV